MQFDVGDQKLYFCYKRESLFVYPSKYKIFRLPILESFL